MKVRLTIFRAKDGEYFCVKSFPETLTLSRLGEVFFMEAESLEDVVALENQAWQECRLRNIEAANLHYY